MSGAPDVTPSPARPAQPVQVLNLIDDFRPCQAWLRMSRQKPVPTRLRIVLVDQAENLARNFAEFQHLYLQHYVVCVVVGPGEETPSGRVLRLPEQLSQDRAAVLWVGDPHGVWWGPDQGRARAGTGQLAGSGLDELLQALCVAEVFEEVVRRARAIPFATASPGIERVSGSLEPGEVTGTLLQVVRQITTESGVPFELDLRTSTAEPSAGTGSAIVEGSEFDRARRAAAAATGRAEESIRRLDGVTGLVGRAAGTAGDRIVAAGQQLDAFSGLVREAAAELDTGARSDTLAGSGLAERGFGPAARFEPSALTDRKSVV